MGILLVFVSVVINQKPVSAIGKQRNIDIEEHHIIDDHAEIQAKDLEDLVDLHNIHQRLIEDPEEQAAHADKETRHIYFDADPMVRYQNIFLFGIKSVTFGTNNFKILHRSQIVTNMYMNIPTTFVIYDYAFE